jgi:hypothetical protein
MNYSIMNRKRTMIGIMSLAVLTLSLLALLSLAPIVNAPFDDSTVLPTPTPFGVGGEIVPVNILQVLAPYLLVAGLGAGAILSLVVYRRRKS